ncbi:hypothetical protein EVA_20702 [gut metagenome]|uniref:Uncharacterized protein n=1 Tax=gut metagenome TaxID=749906 RepID=J9F8G2_9ZZZZ
MPGVMRSRIGWTMPLARASSSRRSSSSRLSTTKKPTPLSSAKRMSASVLLLPWK